MNHFPKFPAQSDIGYVYFAKRPGNLFKIGQCASLSDRRKDHRTTDSDFVYHSAYETSEYKACEAFLKAHFEEKRKNDTSEMFFITEDDITEAIPKALQYASALNEGRAHLETFRAAKATSPAIAPTEEFHAMHERLKYLCGQIDTLQSEVDLIKLSFVMEIGNSQGIEGLLTFKDTKPRLGLVNKAELAEILKIERPDLYEKFWQETFTRPLCVL